MATEKQIKSKVYALYTGGTFGMKQSEAPGNPLTPMPIGELKALLAGNKQKPTGPTMEPINLPDELAKGVQVTIDSLPENELTDSSSMSPSDWVKIAHRIYKHYKDFDGFVIVQGTDTLAYSASALSFIFENLGKPVVVTGAQLPLQNPRSDARLNFGHAVMVAGYKATNLPLVPEVIVVFADKILRGCRSRKMSASSWTGFDSPNAAPIGQIGEQVRIFENQIRPIPAPGLELELNDKLEENVLDFSIFPGLKGDQLASILGLDKSRDEERGMAGTNSLKGIVMRTYGTGNAPESRDFLDVVERAAREAKTIVNITQCPEGTVEMGLYQASMGLLNAGVVSGLDMTPEAALTKLMVTLGTKVPEQVPLQMQINQRGEQSLNLFDVRFNSAEANVQNTYQISAQLDRRFKRAQLTSASLRIYGLKFYEAEKDAKRKDDTILVFLNAGNIDKSDIEYTDLNSGKPEFRFTSEARQRKLIMSKKVSFEDASKPIIEKLPTEQIRNITGDSDLVLTIFSAQGTKFSIDSLSMSLFTHC